MPASFLFPDRDVDLWFPFGMSNKLAQVRYEQCGTPALAA